MAYTTLDKLQKALERTYRLIACGFSNQNIAVKIHKNIGNCTYTLTIGQGLPQKHTSIFDVVNAYNKEVAFASQIAVFDGTQPVVSRDAIESNDSQMIIRTLNRIWRLRDRVSIFDHHLNSGIILDSDARLLLAVVPETLEAIAWYEKADERTRLEMVLAFEPNPSTDIEESLKFLDEKPDTKAYTLGLMSNVIAEIKKTIAHYEGDVKL